MKEEGHEIEMGTPKWKIMAEFDRIGLQSALGPTPNGWNSYFRPYKDDVTIRDAIMNVLGLEDGRAQEVLDPIISEDGNVDWEGVASAFEMRLQEVDDDSGERHERYEGCKEQPEERKGNMPTSKQAELASDLLTSPETMPRIQTPTNIDVVLSEVGDEEPPRHDQPQSSRDRTFLEAGTETEVAEIDTKRDTSGDESFPSQKLPSQSRKGIIIPQSKLGFQTVRGDARISKEAGGIQLMSNSGFTTVRYNVGVFRGKWMYEVQLGSGGIMQLGFTSPKDRFNSEDGVGDTKDSYAYDGKRQKKWNIRPTSYGDKWTGGDIIGCGIDLDNRTVSFWRNGKFLGEAFKNLFGRESGIVYLPGISMSYGESCECNMGGRPFIYPQEGYEPFEERPSKAVCLRAEFVGKALLRFAGSIGVQNEALSRSPRSAAAMAATFAMTPINDSRMGSQPFISARANGNDQTQDYLNDSNNEILGSESNFETQSDYRNEEHLQHSGNLGFVQSAPELLSELAPALLGKACDLHSNNRIQLDATHDLQQDLVSIHKQPLVLKPETILLASIIARFIGPLCLNPYLVEQCILNPLLELCLHESFHESGDFDRLLIILINVLEPFESEYLSYLIIGALARTVRRSIWEPKDFPESPASRFVGYARRFLRVRPFRKAWLDYKLPGGCSCWQRQLEELLEVRQPTINELEEILPHLKWEGDMTDEASTQLVLSASTAKGDFSADYTALSAMHMHLEDAHAFLLRDLCDWSDENPFDVGGDDFFSHTSRSCPAKSQKCVSYSSSRKQQGNLMPWDASLKEVMRLSMAHVKDSLFTASGDEEISVQLSDHISNELGSCLAEINGADSNVIVPQPLGAFLFWLEAKNAGARRDVPPPGLSAPSVLPSVFYATLRVFRHDIFDSIYLRGNDFSIPHGFFFRGLESLEAKRQYSFSRYFNRKPPEPAARLGGSITHLIRENVANLKHCKGDIHIDAKESVPKEKFLDPQLSDSSLDWTGNDLDGPWKWWLIDRLMRLYSLGVAPRIRMGFTYGNTIDQALSSLQHMMARWREERNPGAVELLRLSIEESRKLALTAVRQQCWSVCWMMIPWKQEVSLAVASIVSRVLSIVATKNKLSLPFVPEYYLESVLDIMHSLRQSEARLWDNERLMYSYGFDSIISCIFILSAAEKNGIVSPDAKAMLAQTVGSLLQEENSLPLLAKNPIAMQYLLSAICVQCSDERNWLAVSNGLGEMFSTGGFGAPKDFQYVSLYESKDQNHEVANESNSNSENRDNQIGSGTGPVVGQDPTEESFRHDIGDGDTSAHPDRDSSAIRRRVRSTNPVSLGIENQASMTMQFKYNTSTEEKRDKSLRSSDYGLARYHVSKVLFDGLKHDFSLSDSFLNSIFDHINWTITEMLSIVDELPAGEENSENDLVHRHETSTVRRALATCELAGKLVRTLEAIAVNVPEVLIGDATVLLDGREKAADDADERVSNAALELKTTRLAEIISFGLQQFGPESKAVKWLNKCPVYLIAAYLGIILALKGEPETRTPLSYSRTRQKSLTEALIGQGLKPEIVEKAEKLVLATCEASKEEEESRNLENTGPTKLKFEYPPQYEMDALHSAVKMLWEHYRAVTNLAQNSSQINKAGIEGKGRRDGDIGEEDEAPPEFLDPIMSTVMRDPVLLPSSGIIVDRLTIERHLLSSGSDPFSRAPLTRDELRPDADLRRRITEWRNARIGQ